MMAGLTLIAAVAVAMNGAAMNGAAMSGAGGARPVGLDAYSEFGRTPGKTCKAAPAMRLIGRPATSARLVQARTLAGAAGARWIRPGESVTQDRRADRLNVRVDKAGRISELRCW